MTAVSDIRNDIDRGSLILISGFQMRREPQNLRGISRLARGRRFQKKGYEWGGSSSRPSPWRATDGTILPTVKPSSFAKASDDKPARRPKLSFAERRMVEVAGIRCSASYESQYLFQGFNSRHGGEQAFSLRGGLSPGPERRAGMVEVAGIEPASEKLLRRLSTRLVSVFY